MNGGHEDLEFFTPIDTRNFPREMMTDENANYFAPPVAPFTLEELYYHYESLVDDGQIIGEEKLRFE